jgi:hypothetical protein
VRGDFSRSSAAAWCWGPVYDVVSKAGVEAPVYQFAGSAPSISLYSTSGAADTRKVSLINSAGATTFRTVQDDGTAAIAWGVNQSAGVPSSFETGCNSRPLVDNTYLSGEPARRWAIVHTFYARTHALTVGTLSAAATAGAGSRAFVTDSNVVAAGNFGNVVAGGGANGVPVYSDGTNWRIG